MQGFDSLLHLNMKRFWDKVEKTQTCWLWKAAKRNGYGAIKYKGKIYGAHRFSWFLINGYFPYRLLLHKCNNRLCVNTSHLYEGDHKQNTQDSIKAGTHNTNKGIIKAPHGTNRRYSSHKCRCGLCVQAHSDALKKSRYKN